MILKVLVRILSSPTKSLAQIEKKLNFSRAKFFPLCSHLYICRYFETSVSRVGFLDITTYCIIHMAYLAGGSGIITVCHFGRIKSPRKVL